jgi:hypothetical protein
MRVAQPAVLLALMALLVPAVPAVAVAEPAPESTIETEPEPEPEPEPNAWEWSTEVPSSTVYARLPATVTATLRDGADNPVAGVAVRVEQLQDDAWVATAEELVTDESGQVTHTFTRTAAPTPSASRTSAETEPK